VRIALVTPFAWSQPHDVNEHVAGLASELRNRGHSVTVLAPSNRARDLAAGRRALLGTFDDPPELIAIGPAVRISRRSRMGVPVGVRASLSLALARGRFDVVHGFEPGLPSLSYLALRDSAALTVATFFSPERLGYPPGRAQRERLLARVDALLATSKEVADAAGARFPGRYELVPHGIDPELFAPSTAEGVVFRPGTGGLAAGAPSLVKRKLVVMEWRQTERPLLRALVRELAQLPGWELVLLRTRIPASRPAVSPRLRGRMRVRTARTGAARAELLRAASIFVPAAEGLPRLVAEAQMAGVAIASPPGRAEQPELAVAETARMIEDEAFRERRAAESLAAAETQTLEALADQVEDVYERVALRRRSRTTVAPFEARDWLVADLHLHTSWSHDCSIDVDELLDHAEAQGLGAIAVTDHNVFGGAQEAAERARGRKLVVIPGEEVKTADQGEVIGLFLREEIPRGMSFGETVAAIRAQGGLVYLPHPFDRMHAIPEPATLHRHLAEIDVFEVYNARLLFEAYNDEALRFARKYNLTPGAGSDAHVLAGVGTGAVRMRRFNGPEEFLVSLHDAEVLRRPKSLVYLQGLKWVAQAKERVR
jgi:predicted metal-dependent phosphoesterase TrpH/glycosyltransferase involved in cell wall biosynthesis